MIDSQTIKNGDTVYVYGGGMTIQNPCISKATYISRYTIQLEGKNYLEGWSHEQIFMTAEEAFAAFKSYCNSEIQTLEAKRQRFQTTMLLACCEFYKRCM